MIVKTTPFEGDNAGMDKQPEFQKFEKDNEGNSLLGPHKSSAELKEEERQRRLQEKEDRRFEKRMRRQNPQAPQEKNVTLWVMVGILAFVVLMVGVLIVIQQWQSRKEMAPDSGHFQRADDVPEMSSEGIKGVITEAYYTNDGSLAVKLKLSNAYDTNQYMTSLDVTVKNADGEVIAAGKNGNIQNFYIPAQGYEDFTFYITEQFVEIHDDPLESLTYEINTEGRLENPDATALPDTTASGGETTTASSDTTAATGETTAATTAA